MVEERSLKVLDADKTFLRKITNTLTKMLTPTKIGINGMMISMKRSNLMKSYDAYIDAQDNNKAEKVDAAKNKYEEAYTLYLEAIDKHIMDSVYKKVKNGTATDFEKAALSKYYTIINLKNNEYLEYKFRKQKFLLELDYESIKLTAKEKVIEKYNKLYLTKIDTLYKGILKNYSVQLADSARNKKIDVTAVYNNIFDTLEEYIVNILPIKLRYDDRGVYNKILNDYQEFDKYIVGKLENSEIIEKRMILLGLSRQLFTHSLPLIAAEQCYNKLLTDTRNLIISEQEENKKEDAYNMLIKLLEDYNVKLLSTKVYWEKLDEREEYKKFWNKYSKAKTSKEKEILSIKRELKSENIKNGELIKYYKDKLTEYGVMKRIKNIATTGNVSHYVKIKE